MIKVCIIDDHDLFLQGLTQLVNSIPNCKVVCHASNGKEGLKTLRHNEVDIVLLDINMPDMNGTEVLHCIKLLKLKIQVIMLTMNNSADTIKKALEEGAKGYLFKNASKSELEACINTVQKGEHYYSNEVKDVIMNVLKSQKTNSFTRLTKREKEVLQLICDELTTQEIAEKLFLSGNTVETHRKNLMEKTGARNLAGLVKFALRNKIVTDNH